MALTHEDDTQAVDGPHTPVLHDMPDLFDGKTLAIMHVRLRWVIPQNAVDDNDLLAGKPGKSGYAGLS